MRSPRHVAFSLLLALLTQLAGAPVHAWLHHGAPRDVASDGTAGPVLGVQDEDASAASSNHAGCLLCKTGGTAHAHAGSIMSFAGLSLAQHGPAPLVTERVRSQLPGGILGARGPPNVAV